jgi:hypothetical protein
MESMARKEPRDAALHRGPSLVIVAVVYVALFTASLIVSTAMAGGRLFPSPFGPADDAVRYFGEHADAVVLGAFLQLGAAIPLGVFAASASSRVQFRGMRVAGVQIALFGGVAASVFQALSACVQWVVAQAALPTPTDFVRPLHLLAFVTGGPAHVAALGLLVAGLSLAGGLQRLVSRWLMILGVGIAVVAELSTLTLVSPAVAALLPIARFSALVWMVCLGALLPRSRRMTGTRPPATALPTEVPQA